jgi:hypothetical protein
MCSQQRLVLCWLPCYVPLYAPRGSICGERLTERRSRLRWNVSLYQDRGRINITFMKIMLYYHTNQIHPRRTNIVQTALLTRPQLTLKLPHPLYHLFLPLTPHLLKPIHAHHKRAPPPRQRPQLIQIPHHLLQRHARHNLPLAICKL